MYESRCSSSTGTLRGKTCICQVRAKSQLGDRKQYTWGSSSMHGHITGSALKAAAVGKGQRAESEDTQWSDEKIQGRKIQSNTCKSPVWEGHSSGLILQEAGSCPAGGILRTRKARSHLIFRKVTPVSYWRTE